MDYNMPITQYMINKSLARFLQMALEKKLKRIEPKLFYFHFYLLLP